MVKKKFKGCVLDDFCKFSSEKHIDFAKFSQSGEDALQFPENKTPESIVAVSCAICNWAELGILLNAVKGAKERVIYLLGSKNSSSKESSIQSTIMQMLTYSLSANELTEIPMFLLSIDGNDSYMEDLYLASTRHFNNKVIASSILSTSSYVTHMLSSSLDVIKANRSLYLEKFILFFIICELVLGMIHFGVSLFRG